MKGRAVIGAALLLSLAALLAGACDDSDDPPQAATPPATSSAAVTPAATATPSQPLAARIGVRGGLRDADPIDLAARFGITQGRVPATLPFAGEPAVGDTRSFFVTRITGAAVNQTVPPDVVPIDATLRAASEHAYFYVDNALDPSVSAVEAAAADFEATVWPVVTGVFGLPATPGVDGDPRIIVLQADLGGSVGGYVTGWDQYPRAVASQSNEAEMIYLDRTLRPGEAGFSVVLAHELQHLIHQRNDSGEEAWVNEGLSETASQLVGGAVSSIGDFEANPATQLNHWSSAGSGPHYGAGAAFFRYVADLFGGDAMLGEIARTSDDGAVGVDAFARAHPCVACSGSPSFTTLFADWIAANLLNSATEPRFANPARTIDPQIEYTLAPGEPTDGNATQFGADYYQVEGADTGEFVLRFEGAAEVDVLPIAPDAGGGIIWSNEGDEIDTSLTYDLDLRGATDPEITFRLWYDIERWYDWGYVAVSTDGGASWEALAGAQTSDDDRVKVAYGPGYTGRSGDGDGAAWVDERMSLAAYAGKRVLLRFEYVTDGASHGEGWAIDALTVSGAPAPEPAFDGWVRVDGALSQTYVVRLIANGPDGAAVVRDIPLDASQRGELRFTGDGLTNVVVAIAGTTEGTNLRAPYRLEMARP